MRVRLFFAIIPDDKTKAALAKVQEGVLCKANPVVAENLHLTLAFLGNCEENQVDCIANAALEVKARPFEIKLNRYRMLSRQQILTCIPSGENKVLRTVQKQLVQSLKKCDIQLHNKFMPHVSLFRKVKTLPQANRLDPAVCWKIKGFALVQSSLKQDRAYYEVLKSYDF